MPDVFDEIAPSPSSSKGDVFDEIAPDKEKKKGKSQVGEFFSTLGSDILDIPGAVYGAAKDLPGTLKGMESAREGEVEAGAQAFKKGQYGEAIRRGVFGQIPVIGPALSQAGTEAGRGEYGKAAAHALELTPVPELAARGALRLGKTAAVAAKGKLTPRTVLNPKEAQAIEFAEKQGVPTTVGQRTGQLGLQKMERGLENFPGSASKTEDFFKGQQAKLAETGEKLTQRASPVKTNAYGAGKQVQDALSYRVTRLKTQADRLYDQVRSEAAANTKTVQTGLQTSPVVGPSGQPITTPVFKTLETPVELAPIRDALKPVFDDLERSLPEARRANSPAFRALSDVMKSTETHMNAMDFDRFLSAVKSMSRDGKSELLTSKSQGIARKIIQEGESQFQAAMQTAGPDTMDKLTKARGMVKAYYGTDELLNSLRDEPAALYKNLVSGGDVTFNTLQELRKVAPRSVNVVGRTFLEGLLSKATAEGGFGRSAGVLADWQRMGPETKQLLFGPQLTADMDKYLLAAKRLTPVEGSATAGRISTLLPFGIGAEVVRQILTGNIAGAGLTVAGGAAMEYAIPNIAARVLFSQDGARLAARALTLPPGSSAWNSVTRRLFTAARGAQIATENRDEQ